MELGDCSEWMRIRKIAYQGPTNLIVHHRPVSDESLAEVVEERKKELNAPGAFHWKVVDVETGKMMTAAKFELHNVGMEKPAKPVDEVATSKDPRFVPPEVNMPALMALLGLLGQARKEVMGERPYLMLDTLSTLPEYRRRGAAALLVKWGAKKADELGIELYLTSSMVARPLYEKMGFVLVKDMWFDRGPGVERAWIGMG
jgi:GNAT superfamily N-acetyltransferase